MSELVAPFGGAELKPLLVPQSELADQRARAANLPQVPMTSRETSDLVMMAMGAYTPIDGFMGHDDWHGVCQDMQLSNGLFWPIPITLSCAANLAEGINLGDDVALVDGESSELIGILEVAEKYTIDKAFECSHVYRTADAAHPGVQKVMEQEEVNLAGRVKALSESNFPDTYSKLYLRPAESRALFAEKGWSTVAAFQTRNPMHRSHEHLAKIAVERCSASLSQAISRPMCGPARSTRWWRTTSSQAL